MIFKYFKDKDLLVYYSEDDQEWRFCLQNRHSRSKPSKMVEAFWKMCTLTKVTYSHPSITVLGKEFSWLSSQVLDLPNISFLFSVSPLLVHSKDIQGALVAAWQAHGFLLQHLPALGTYCTPQNLKQLFFFCHYGHEQVQISTCLCSAN